MAFASAVFVVSLVAIAALFGLKSWEEKRARVWLPKLRAALDARALQAAELLFALEADVQKLPTEAVHAARAGIRFVALESAHLARVLETHSHKLADLVSHKGHFVPRAPRSEFLNKVMEHKNGNGSGNGQDGTTNV